MNWRRVGVDLVALAGTAAVVLLLHVLLAGAFLAGDGGVGAALLEGGHAMLSGDAEAGPPIRLIAIAAAVVLFVALGLVPRRHWLGSALPWRSSRP